MGGALIQIFFEVARETEVDRQPCGVGCQEGPKAALRLGLPHQAPQEKLSLSDLRTRLAKLLAQGTLLRHSRW